ncbi:MAG: SPASM domain-containing protein [Planctomycetota bacterium]|nr:SPASM domain-containing protein [Planctomycetota bacterium]
MTATDARSGASAVSEELSWPLAKAVIDAALEHAQAKGGVPASLTFHGAGEPTLHWELLVRAVEYAKARDGACRVSLSSNGVWTDEQRAFICKHFHNVSLSMDGTRDVQNNQRPMAGGGGSFARVMETAAALDEARVEYGIRMTALPASVHALADGVRFICHNTRAAAIQIEPTFTSCRGRYSDLDADFADAFAAAFMDAWRAGLAAGRNVYYSGARPWVISWAFCLAPIQAMVVTPQGQLVTCFEMFSGARAGVGAFTVGRVHEGRVAYDYEALRRFLAEQERGREGCRECFCYWHCCGDCATRRQARGPFTAETQSSQRTTRHQKLETGNLVPPRLCGEDALSGRCRLTRAITRDMLAHYISAGQGVWQGLRDGNGAGGDGRGGQGPGAR